jgi:hypothetical protein
MAKKPSAPGDGGFSNPTIYDTLEEATMSAARTAEIDAAYDNMTWAERHEWLEHIKGQRPEDLE